MHESASRNIFLYTIISLALCSIGPSAAQALPSVPGREQMPPARSNDACKGTVTQYLLNPRGEVDGLFLSDDTQIHFPPHMSSELVKCIKAGDRITATGMHQSAQVFVAWKIVQDKSGFAVVDIGPPQPPQLQQLQQLQQSQQSQQSHQPHQPHQPPKPLQSPAPRTTTRPMPRSAPELKVMQVKGSVKAFLRGPRGDVNGFLLSDKTVVRMPPETAFSLSNVFQLGQVISARGNGSESGLGRCIEATSIGTDGQPMISIYETGFSKNSQPERP